MVDIPEARPGTLAGKTVYLHIGAPKTGTSYVQARLDANVEAVAEQGMLWPQPWGKQVKGAREVKALGPRGSLSPEGDWQALVEEARAWPGPRILISMEWLANAAPHQAAAAVSSFVPATVEVVCTARDVVRSLPAAWQESMQNFRTWTWHEYLDAVTASGESSHPGAVEFWGQQDVARIAKAWTSAVPAERFHLVTVPGRGAAPGLLWERFCSVVGLSSADFVEPTRSNPSLGAASAALMQRFNVAARERGMQRRDYQRLVKHTLSKGILAERRSDEGGIALPMDAWERLSERSTVMLEEVQQLPVSVVGDLQELVPEPPGPGRDPESVPDHELLEAAVHGLVGLVEASSSRERRRQRRAVTADGEDRGGRVAAILRRARSRVLPRSR